jgi:HEAT repeat protein
VLPVDSPKSETGHADHASDKARDDVFDRARQASQSNADDQTADSAESAADAAPAPMTPTLMGRLFVVPAILVSMFVVGLTTVVLLFGWSSFSDRPTIDQLITRLESASGGRQAGALFPQDKDVWLAAQELASRLQDPTAELQPNEIDPVARRLAGVYENLSAESPPREQADIYKVYFTLLAISHLESPVSVDTLISGLGHASPDARRAALRGLIALNDYPDAHRAVPALILTSTDSDKAVRMEACMALGLLGEGPRRGSAVAALAQRLSEDREVRWNAATALGRLGSAAGKTTLLQMLSREEWAQQRKQYTAKDGRDVDLPFSALQTDQAIIAAIDAAEGLDDADLKAAIAGLVDDPSGAVRVRAAEAASK